MGFYFTPWPMLIDSKLIEELIFKRFANNLRFTQDSPVYPDVWLHYFNNAAQIREYRADLILSPHLKASAADLFTRLVNRLDNIGTTELDQNPWEIASSGEIVAAKLTLFELVSIVLPMTNWWQEHLWDREGRTLPEFRWLQVLIGAILYVPFRETNQVAVNGNEELLKIFETSFKNNFRRLDPPRSEFGKRLSSGRPFKPEDMAVLWSVNRNRPATITIEKSVGATKADACRKLFDIDGSTITWAVFDTGIDASHPAFLKKDPVTKKLYTEPFGTPEDRNSNHTRIIASYDFTKFRSILAEIFKGSERVSTLRTDLLKATGDRHDRKLKHADATEYINEIEKDLRSGRALDWTIISPLLRIPHNKKEYMTPTHPHGTHVAGILGAGQFRDDGTPLLVGMCPCIQLYDIRVLDGAGSGDEFNILAALQFVRWLNNQRDGQVVHGINLSFSMIHAVASYACGATPVCESCERSVAEGTIVVAAAGNLGQSIYQNTDGAPMQGFRMVNITDPGNAEGVITVGATHRNRPHSYGVSYFSSKGPTGDGRVKPDLVAPGEKIVSSVLSEGTDRMDGTSMAAPHVSGAAALLLAKHNELIGNPKRVKEILCKTATDLGREKYFQGCGMIDVLRAIQSV
jgi:serine protease AprX